MALALMLAALAQDPQEHFREALYQEIDRGDLAAAIELYGRIEKQAPAPLAAKALLRRGLCLEKQGKRDEARRLFEEVVRRHADQRETAAQAEARLAAAGPTSPDGAPRPQSIQDLIFDLGSPRDYEQFVSTMRRLTIHGEEAVPALQRAMAHPDVDLSAAAACVLVNLGKYDGTYDPLVRGIREDRILFTVGQNSFGLRITYDRNLASLIKQRPADRERFVREFLAARSYQDIKSYMDKASVAFSDVASQPEVQRRVDELFVSGPVQMCSSFLRRMDKKDEKRHLQLLLALDPADETSIERAKAMELHLTGTSYGRVDFALDPWVAALVRLDPDAKSDLLNPYLDHCEEHFPRWLRTGAHIIRSNTERMISRKLPILARALGEEGDKFGKLELRTEDFLLDRLSYQTWKGDDVPVVESILSYKYQSPLTWPEHRLKVLDYLCNYVRESNPLWDACAAYQIRTLDERGAGAAGFIESLTADGKTRLRAIIARELDDPNGRHGASLSMAQYVGIVPMAEKLAAIALDSARPEELRLRALDALRQGEAWSVNRSTMNRLAGSELSEGMIGELERRLHSFYHDPKIPESLATLADLLKNESYPEALRAGALSVFDNVAGMERLPVLIERATKDRSAGIRRWAVSTLDKYGGPAVHDAMVTALGDKEADIRELARSYILGHAVKGDAGLVAEALKDKSVEIRRKAAVALGSLEELEAVPALIERLNDPDPTVRKAVRDSLEAIKNRHDEEARWRAWFETVRPGGKPR
jgi:HEAT repeat protein